MQLRVLSYNIQHCHPYLQKEWDEINFRLFADVIRCFDPDIVGLNEVRGEGESPSYGAQARILAEALGYHAFFAPAIHVPKGGPYGNAILSKLPPAETEIIPIPDPERDPSRSWYESRCVAKAVYPIGGGVTMLTTHFGLNPEEAQNAAKTVCAEVQKAETPVILTGDFNLRPENPILAPIRALLADTADMFSCPQLSYPSDAPKEKIDYIFTSPSVKPRFACIPPVVASDHRPYLAVLELPETV